MHCPPHAHTRASAGIAALRIDQRPSPDCPGRTLQPYRGAGARPISSARQLPSGRPLPRRAWQARRPTAGAPHPRQSQLQCHKFIHYPPDRSLAQRRGNDRTGADQVICCMRRQRRVRAVSGPPRMFVSACAQRPRPRNGKLNPPTPIPCNAPCPRSAARSRAGFPAR